MAELIKRHWRSIGTWIIDVEHLAGKRFARVVRACMTGEYTDRFGELWSISKTDTSNVCSFEAKVMEEFDQLREGMVWSGPKNRS